ncbi:MAG: hypothetical protein LUD01_04845 [Clostridiales bacterium]|nr:hypothetical protein [Clostridiales bacterium]
MTELWNAKKIAACINPNTRPPGTTINKTGKTPHGFQTIRKISAAEFTRWLRSSRLIILGVMLVFIHMQVIRPLCDCAARMGEPVAIQEAFVALGNSGQIVLIIPLLFLVLIADFPQKNGIDLFYQIRCPKKIWILGQTLFAALAAFFLVAFLFLSSGIMILGNATWQTDFSHAVTHYLSVYPERTADYVVQLLPANLYQQMTLPEAVFFTATLMWFYFLLLALILLLSTLYSRKYAGVLADAFLIILGAITSAADVSAKWLFPMAHTISWIHYTEYFREQIVPIKASYLYLMLCCAGLFAFCMAAAGQYQAGKETE